jgi:hypothetical protein
MCLLVSALSLILTGLLRCQEPHALPLSGDYPFTHDPSIAREGSMYYVFATTSRSSEGQFPIRCSHDLLAWKFCGHVFDGIPEWIQEASPTTKNLWAPDVSYFQGKYHLYYAYSAFGVNTSGIALATNETLDAQSPKYHWRDEGLVLKSTREDNFNAIDPNIVFDEKGRPWLSFGSFWGGIKMRRIDPITGKPSTADPTLYSLARQTGRLLRHRSSCAMAATTTCSSRSICVAAVRGAPIEQWWAGRAELLDPMSMPTASRCSKAVERNCLQPTAGGSAPAESRSFSGPRVTFSSFMHTTRTRESLHCRSQL